MTGCGLHLEGSMLPKQDCLTDRHVVFQTQDRIQAHQSQAQRRRLEKSQATRKISLHGEFECSEMFVFYLRCAPPNKVLFGQLLKWKPFPPSEDSIRIGDP
ncbi:hypothetical protein QYF36_007878 [Acer negundo]|nr:hypothetical protein QYF36_007878 [Acer negundo]